MCTTVNLYGDWILIVEDKYSNKVDELVRTMGEVGRTMGIRIEEPLQR